jgi:peptidoglycan/xylan/chitin deacetylase (PgdA/CDA1 family)
MQILMYHNISEAGTAMCLRPAAFARQVEWLHQAGWKSLTLREAMAADHPPRHSVVLTFDDGFADAHSTAWPLLRERGMTATLFVVTDQVGQVPSWRNAAPVAPLLDWGQTREMARDGWEFGSHTASHLDVRTATDDEIYEELVRSKGALEEQVETEVVSFAYPYGYFRSALPDLLRKAGYRYAVLAGGYRSVGARSDPMRLDRTPVDAGETPTKFRLKVSGWMAYRHYTEKVVSELRWEWTQTRRKRAARVYDR